MNKYKAKRTVLHGITFDSKAESEYYQYLLDEQEKGTVTTIELQPAFELIPRFTRKGKVIRKTVYKADFRVTYADGACLVIDVKGKQTPVFKLKKKLFEFHYPDLELRLYKKAGKKWVEV